MPPVAKWCGTLVLYDVNTRPEFAPLAEECLLSICGYKNFSASKDKMQLVLLNTEETNNTVADQFKKCQHISVATDVVLYRLHNIKQCITDVATAEANWIDGLVVAIECLKQNFFEQPGILSMQLLFITDFSVKTERVSQKRIDYVIEVLHKLNIRLVIAGPAIKIPNFLNSHEDIQNLMQDVEFIEENSNYENVLRIVKPCNGVICDTKMGEFLFLSREVHSPQAWKVPLTLATSLSLQTQTSRILKKRVMPRIRPEIERREPNEPEIWVLAEDGLTEIPFENVVSGVYKHDILVPLPSEVRDSFKAKGERSFKIFGFTPRSKVPDVYLHGDGSHIVEGDPRIRGTDKPVRLLVQELAKADKCLIAQRVYMKNCRPKLVVLLPDTEQGHFCLVELPYKENKRRRYKESDPKAVPEPVDEDSVKQGINEFLDSLDFTNSESSVLRDANGSLKFPLNPRFIPSFKFQVIYQRCRQKYFGIQADKNFEIDFNEPNIGMIQSGLQLPQYEHLV